MTMCLREDVSRVGGDVGGWWVVGMAWWRLGCVLRGVLRGVLWGLMWRGLHLLLVLVAVCDMFVHTLVSCITITTYVALITLL